MISSRRQRFQRESDRSGNAQALFHVITVAVILGIVFFEDAIRHISLESQLLESVPLRGLGSDLDSNTGYAYEPNLMKEQLGVHSRETHLQPLNKKVSGNKEPVQSTLEQQGDHTISRQSEDITVKGQNVDSAAPGANLNETEDNSVGSSTNHSVRTILRSRGETISYNQGNWINVDAFRKQAEERAMYDALQKRAAILSHTAAILGDPTSGTPKAVEPESKNVNKSSTGNTKSDGGTIPEFRGVLPTDENAELFKADNLTHLSFMVYRLIRTHNLTSLLDIPCTKSMFWMPNVLARLEFEVPGFHYRCIVPDDEYLVEAILRFKDLTSAVVLKDPTFWASKLPTNDIAFTWYGVGYLAPRQSWQLLKALHQSKTKYVLIPHHPDVSSNPGGETRSGRVNVRRSPYRFDEAFRVVNNISDTFPRKQLLMYELEGLRIGVL